MIGYVDVQSPFWKEDIRFRAQRYPAAIVLMMFSYKF